VKCSIALSSQVRLLLLPRIKPFAIGSEGGEGPFATGAA
jgi:hypothetical protein